MSEAINTMSCGKWAEVGLLAGAAWECGKGKVLEFGEGWEAGG